MTHQHGGRGWARMGVYWNVEFLLEFITLTLGRLDCIWGVYKQVLCCKQDIKAILRSLDWLQPLKKVLYPQYEGRIRVFPAVSKVEYRMDARDLSADQMIRRVKPCKPEIGSQNLHYRPPSCHVLNWNQVHFKGIACCQNPFQLLSFRDAVCADHRLG